MPNKKEEMSVEEALKKKKEEDEFITQYKEYTERSKTPLNEADQSVELLEGIIQEFMQEFDKQYKMFKQIQSENKNLTSEEQENLIAILAKCHELLDYLIVLENYRIEVKEPLDFLYEIKNKAMSMKMNYEARLEASVRSSQDRSKKSISAQLSSGLHNTVLKSKSIVPGEVKKALKERAAHEKEKKQARKDIFKDYEMALNKLDASVREVNKNLFSNEEVKMNTHGLKITINPLNELSKEKKAQLNKELMAKKLKSQLRKVSKAPDNKASNNSDTASIKSEATISVSGGNESLSTSSTQQVSNDNNSLDEEVASLTSSIASDEEDAASLESEQTVSGGKESLSTRSSSRSSITSANDNENISSESPSVQSKLGRPSLQRSTVSRNIKSMHLDNLKSKEQESGPTNKLMRTRSKSLENLGLFSNGEGKQQTKVSEDVKQTPGNKK